MRGFLVRRASLLAFVRYALACILLLGTALPFAVASPAPADETACSLQTVECTVKWKAGSSVCKQQGKTDSCTTLYQGQHVTVTEAKEWCEKGNGVALGSGAESCDQCHLLVKNDCLEQCKELCYKAWEKCRDNCPRGDKNCLSECTNTLAGCNRECDKKCK
jgi:hypothetical protein